MEIYHSNSGEHFSHLLENALLQSASVPNTKRGSANFVNTVFHDNIHKAKQIMLAVYDRKNMLREQLTFQGNGSVWNWFQVQNVIDSTLWEMDSSDNFDIFKFNPDPDSFIFEITKNAGSGCGATGLFKMTCDLNTVCDELKWWIYEPSLNDQPCGVLYSKYSNDVDYRNAFWASKIQILTKDVAQRNFELLFVVEAFAGVDAYDYYDTGLLENPDDNGVTHAHKLFRHPNIRDKIESASLIQLQVYNFEMTNVVSTLTFYGTNDFDSWFSGNNIVNSSLWDVRGWPNDTLSGRYFQLSDVSDVGPASETLRKFFINHSYDSCSGDSGWLMAVSRTTDTIAPCPYEHWWQKDSITA